VEDPPGPGRMRACRRAVEVAPRLRAAHNRRSSLTSLSPVAGWRVQRPGYRLRQRRSTGLPMPGGATHRLVPSPDVRDRSNRRPSHPRPAVTVSAQPQVPDGWERVSAEDRDHLSQPNCWRRARWTTWCAGRSRGQRKGGASPTGTRAIGPGGAQRTCLVAPRGGGRWWMSVLFRLRVAVLCSCRRRVPVGRQTRVPRST